MSMRHLQHASWMHVSKFVLCQALAVCIDALHWMRRLM